MKTKHIKICIILISFPTSGPLLKLKPVLGLPLNFSRRQNLNLSPPELVSGVPSLPSNGASSHLTRGTLPADCSSHCQLIPGQGRLEFHFLVGSEINQQKANLHFICDVFLHCLILPKYELPLGGGSSWKFLSLFSLTQILPNLDGHISKEAQVYIVEVNISCACVYVYRFECMHFFLKNLGYVEQNFDDFFFT